MASLAQVGASHCIHFENMRCKSAVFNYGNNTGVSKMKETSINIPSPLNFTKRKHISQWHKRGNLADVSASPLTEDAVSSTEPLTKEDPVGYLASGCKPKEKWRIGTEHEKFGFEIETLRPMKYNQISALLNGIAERFDWEKIMEGENIIGLTQVHTL